MSEQHPLFLYATHEHKPRNINLVHEAEQAAGSFNQKVATRLTKVFQAMPTFWLIVAWIAMWIVMNATVTHFDPPPWSLLLALASIPQLPLMIVIMVGQGLLGRKQELQSEEQFNTTQKTYHDLEVLMKHLDAQDAEILKHTSMLQLLLQQHGQQEVQVSVDPVTADQLIKFKGAQINVTHNDSASNAHVNVEPKTHNE